MKIRVYLANKDIFITEIITIVYPNAKKAIIVIIITLLDNVKNAKHNVKNVSPTKIVQFAHKDTIYKVLFA